jgi:lactoylglutathione lyase
MRAVMLFVTGLVVGLGIHTVVAQGPNQGQGLVGLNHVMIRVPDMDKALAYYTQTLGFPEAFRVNDDQGRPRLVYVQISQNTFVELQTAGTNPAGMSHFGLHVEDMEKAVAMFKARGANVGPIRNSDTGAILSNITDLNGITIEMAELPDASLHRQAMNRWNR